MALNDRRYDYYKYAHYVAKLAAERQNKGSRLSVFI